MNHWPYAFGGPCATAQYRAQPEHFQVDELSELQPSGYGDYLLLKIQKRDINTAAVASELAKYFTVKPFAVSYAGRKDKQAVTRQWFSIKTAESYDDCNQQIHDKFSVIASCRHHEKIQIGALSGNRFTIHLTQFKGDRNQVESNLENISKQGIPNYFGPQRFGSKNQNLIRGQRMLAGELRVREKNQRSLYLSACRSFLFNEILAEHVKHNCWQNCIGYIPGDGDIPADCDTRDIIEAVLQRHESLVRGVSNSRVAWHKRPQSVPVTELDYCCENDLLVLSFSLPKGSFATSLLREVIE